MLVAMVTWQMGIFKPWVILLPVFWQKRMVLKFMMEKILQIKNVAFFFYNDIKKIYIVNMENITFCKWIILS